MADGVVSEDEYRKAIDGFVSCVRDAGYPVTDPVLSPIDGLTLLYDLAPSGDPDAWNKKTEDCNQAHVSHIEPAYVEGRKQTMAPALQAATVKCLRGKGFALPDKERDVKDFVEATDHVGNAVMECVTTAMEREFPAMPDLLKIRW